MHSLYFIQICTHLGPIWLFPRFTSEWITHKFLGVMIQSSDIIEESSVGNKNVVYFRLLQLLFHVNRRLLCHINRFFTHYIFSIFMHGIQGLDRVWVQQMTSDCSSLFIRNILKSHLFNWQLMQHQICLGSQVDLDLHWYQLP